MRFNRSDPSRQTRPGVSGRVVVTTWRGKPVVRSWPRKRGKPKSPIVRKQNEWFRSAVKACRETEGLFQAAAIAGARGSGLYPRDVLMKCYTVGLFDIIDENGTLIRNRRPFLETVMFQGAILALDANQPYSAGANLPIEWPLPIEDTAAFWNPDLPSRLTIPEGVTVVSLSANVLTTASTSSNFFFNIRKNGTLALSNGQERYTGTKSSIVTTGAIFVQPGDYFEAVVNTVASCVLSGTEATAFSLTVLGAEG